MTKYYDGWETHTYRCEKCGWQGVGKDCGKGHTYEMLFGLDCPSCGEELDVVEFPAIWETRANWDKASEADRLMTIIAEKGYKEVQATLLRRPEQLPEIRGDELIFVWDHERPKVFEPWTVIRYGERIVWRERCGWEIYRRFVEVVNILKAKYGQRLVDVVPTLRSQDALYGDNLAAPTYERKARASLLNHSGS